MAYNPDLSKRSTDPEIMDNLVCSGQVVEQTLRELDVINRWLGGNSVTLGALKFAIRRAADPKRPISIADLGCGSGELLRQVAEFGRREKISLELTGIDANPNIIEFARTHCKEYPEIRFEQLNVLSEEFSRRSYDIIAGTLFFHHFDDEVLSQLFGQLVRQARIGLLINDIHRHWLAYHSIRMLTRWFSRSSMVRYDAPLSVRRAFIYDDWTSILARSGVTHCDIQWKWAFRWRIRMAASAERLAQFW